MHQASQKIFHLRIAFADHYLDNLVAMPLLLEVMVVERKWLYGMNDFDLSRLEITIATIYIIFISEWLFPMLSHRFYFDWWDLVCYAAGALLFAVVQQKERKTQKNI